MIVRRSLKKKIIISVITIGSVACITGAAVGGYFASYNSNPYKSYYRTIATNSTQSFLSSYLAAKMSGAQLLLLPGFTLKSSMEVALKDATFNDTAFLLIDDIYNGPSSTQVSTVKFRVEEGSFITGIAIGMYLNQYKDYFIKDDNKLTWGCYGGLYIDAVVAYMSGFQLGIKWFNDNIVTKNKDLLPVEQIFLGKSAGRNFAGGFGPTDGNAIIDNFLSQPIDCLIPVAGPQASSAAAKIFQKQSKRTIVIGVDSALEEDKTFLNYKLPIDANVKSPTDIVPFSSLKKIDAIIPSIIDAINNNSAPKNNIGGLGYNSLADINNNGVGISKKGESYFIDALRLYSNTVNNITDAINLIKQDDIFLQLGNPQYSVYYTYDNPKYIPNPISNPDSGSYIYKATTSGTLMPTILSAPPSDVNMTQKQWDEKINFNLLNFVQNGNQNDSNKIELILSTPTSVLLDASFAQSTYIGMYNFYKKNNINIPPIKG